MSAAEFLDAKRQLYELVLDEFASGRKNMKELEHWKSIELPNILLRRYNEEPELYLTKEELKKLMDWKLTKGTFRPSLRKLINSNEEKDVVYLTKYAFKMILDVKDTKPDKEEYIKLIRAVLITVTALKGVGPATGSLILSLLNKITNLAPPFYSDEAALYVFYNYGSAENLKLRYTLPEYIKWLNLMWDFNNEYKYDFTDLENGIWALKLNEYYEIKPGEKSKDDDGTGGDSKGESKEEYNSEESKFESVVNTEVKDEEKAKVSQKKSTAKTNPTTNKSRTSDSNTSNVEVDRKSRTRSRKIKNEEVDDHDQKIKKQKTKQ